MKVEQEDSGFEAAWTAQRACLRSDAPDDRQSFKAGWNAAKGFKPIIITLETEEEAAWMWARLETAANPILEGALHLPNPIVLPSDHQHHLWGQFDAVYDARQGRYGRGSDATEK